MKHELLNRVQYPVTELNVVILDPDSTRSAQVEESMGDAANQGLHVYKASGFDTALNICTTVNIDVLLMYMPLIEPGETEHIAGTLIERFRFPVLTYAEELPVNEDRLLRLGVQDFLVLGRIQNHWIFRAIRRAIGRFERQESLFRGSPEDPEIVTLSEDPQVQQVRVYILSSVQVNWNGALDARRYSSFVFANCESLAARVLEDEPDIVIVDHSRGDMPPLNVVRDLKRLRPMEYVPILFLSAQLGERDAIAAFEAGIDDVLTRPVSFAALSGRMDSLLRLSKREHNLRIVSARLENEKRMLSRYFSADFVENLLNDEISEDLGGKLQPATVLFFDLRNSTGLAASLSPERFSALLNSLFHDLMDIVYSGNGTVNKLMGDGMLVTFGCPIVSEKDATAAVAVALKIREYFEALNEFNLFGLPTPLHFGVGIATGNVFAGNIGSFRKMEFTVLGDPVNTASRLEGLTKHCDCDILLDETTALSLRNSVLLRNFRTRIRGKLVDQRIFGIPDPPFAERISA